MKQSNPQWIQTLVYSIDSDKSALYEADKIIFHHQNLKRFHQSADLSKVMKVFSIYGDYATIQHKINQLYPQNSLIFGESTQQDDKGRIVAIANDSAIILCLVIPQQQLIIKPLNDKSMEITLFRILQDMTSTILACLNDEVLNHWYVGENIPFHEQHISKLEEYQIEQSEQENIEIKQTKVEVLIPDSYDGWKTLIHQNNEPFIMLYKKMKNDSSNELDFQRSIDNLISAVILDLYRNGKVAGQSVLDKNLKKIYQTNEIFPLIFEFIDGLKPVILRFKDEQIKKLQSVLTTFIVFKKNCDLYVSHLENCLSDKNGMIILTRSLITVSDQKKDEINKFEKDFLKELNSIIQNQGKQFKHLMLKCFTENKIEQESVICQRCKFETMRETGKSNNILKLTFSTSSTEFIIDVSKLQNFSRNIQLDQIEPIFIAQTWESNQEILILKKSVSYFALLITSKGDTKKIANFENVSQPCFLYIAQLETLYCFNQRSDVAKIQIDELGKLKGDQTFFGVQQDYTMKKVVYLSYNQSFIGLDTKGQVLKWCENEEFNIIQRLKIDMGVQQSIDFSPSQNSKQPYIQLYSGPNGKIFFLSNGFAIDIFDLNYSLLKTIDQAGNIKLFNDSFDGFIIDIEGEFEKKRYLNRKATVIMNLSNNRRITQLTQIEQEKSKEGNPFLDLVKGSQVKYGPISQFLQRKLNKQIQILMLNTSGKEKLIKEYIDFRDLVETCTFEFPINNQKCLEILNTEEYDIDSVLRIAYSRVPTQFCTIENNQLIPLIDGFRMQVNQNQRIAVSTRAKLLTLGYIEDFLYDLSEKIFVVSIIGRQSSGKSYLLNRLFGTRFSVAASRCTDGVWASITHINDKQFLILDCEGLFSRQRNNSEETQLLAFLAGICDITILNQDLSFSRYLDELLDNLTGVIGKLQGGQLFKGNLLIALRDINSKDKGGASEQLLQSILNTKGKNSKSSNFMKTLFNDKFKVQQFQSFEHCNFPKTVEVLRKEFLKFFDESHHWKTGKTLVETIKILLIQLETKDIEDTDSILQKMKIDEVIEKCKRSWAQFQENQELLFQEKKYENKDYILWEENESHQDFSISFQNLHHQISSDLALVLEISKHNQNLLNIESFLEQLLAQRKAKVMANLDQELKSLSNPQNSQEEFLKSQRNKLFTYLEEQESEYKFCKSSCSVCHLNCSKFCYHSKQLQIKINKTNNKLQELKKKIERENYLQNEELNKEINAHKQDRQGILEKLHQLELELIHQEQLKNILMLSNRKQNLQEKLNSCTLIDEQLLLSAKLLLEQYGDLKDYRISESDCIMSISNSAESLQNWMQQQKSKLQDLLIQKQSKINQQQQLIQELQLQEKKLLSERDNINKLKLQQILISSETTEKIQQIQFQCQAIQQQIEQLNSKLQKTDDGNLQEENLQKTTTSSIIHQQYQSFQMQIDRQQIFDTEKQVAIDIKSNELKIEEILQRIKILESEKTNMKPQLQFELNRYQEKISKTKSDTLFQHYQDLLRQYLKLSEQILKVQAIKNWLEPKQQFKKNSKIMQSEIDKLNQDHKIKIDYFSKDSTFQQCFTATQNQENIVQQKRNQLIQENSELELAKEILEAIPQITPDIFQQSLFDKQSQNLQEQYEEDLKAITQEISYLYDEKITCEVVISILLEDKQQLLLEAEVLQKQREIKNLKSEQKEQILKLEKAINEQERIKVLLQNIEIQLKEHIQKQQEVVHAKHSLNQVCLTKQNCINKIDKIFKTFQNELSLLQEYQNCSGQLKQLSEQLKLNESAIKKETKYVSGKIEEIIKQKQAFEDKSNILRQKIILLEAQYQELNQYEKLIVYLNELKDHEKLEHSCLRESHECDQSCVVCNQVNKKCSKMAGHQQEHLCKSSDHYCTLNCQIINCKKVCKKTYLHVGEHSCLDLHQCLSPCEYCGQACKYDLSQDHLIHECTKKDCTINCSMCNRTCIHDHTHSRANADQHFCDKAHSCIQLCTILGMCSYIYESEIRIWNSPNANFEYTYFKQLDGGKQPCTQEIAIGKQIHVGQHTCKAIDHKCGAKCPECDGLCQKIYGHEGFHSAPQHRNKDNQVFTLAKGQGSKIILKEDSTTTKEYKVGESSSPETCTDSCKRRANSHFHLIKCEGGSSCLERKNTIAKVARHQTETYQGFEDIQFDEVLCMEFWKLNKWEHPLLDGDKLANLQRCDFFCPFCPKTNKQFCQLPAWHSNSDKFQDHKFLCIEQHNNNNIMGMILHLQLIQQDP